ncbi:hypothetical protein F4802DRAFT_123981 [Xylaria palmicola]|nr:hypothetical protein F4802DRAFT_123981 [Xylaria palmicola]
MASDDWEFYKNEISCLYLLERLPLKDVSARMKEEHNFDKKKHQYEYQFKKWGFKKNIQRDVWRYVSHRVQKRKMLGKPSEITLFGMQLPPDKVRKEVQRYTAIPTMKDFGTDVPSPANPGRDIVRVITPTPPDFRHQWPETLPWLRFKEKFQIDHLKAPDIGKALVAAWAVSSEGSAQNPLALYPEIGALACSIPQSRDRDLQYLQSSLWESGPSAIAVESLNIILFSLANNRFDTLFEFGVLPFQGEDEFILWLFERFTESNITWSIGLLTSSCPITNAISEVVWGCAIRQKRYDVISRLLKTGIDLNMPVHDKYMTHHSPLPPQLKRGKIEMRWHEPLWTEPNALESAVSKHDIRLAKLLLNAGAVTKMCTSSFLEFITTHFQDEDHALEFAELFVGYAVESDLLPALRPAIAKHYNRLTKGWVDKVHPMELISYTFKIKDGLGMSEDWHKTLKIDCTMLHIAITSGNTEMTNFLLEMTLARADQVSKKTLKDILMVACFAGDRSTIEQLVASNVDWDDGDWPGGVSPLVATAWNPDIEIAEMILQVGAFSDHDIGDCPPVTRSPLPIHVATRSGNTNFVQWLIGHGRHLNTLLSPSFYPENHWLVPFRFTTPLGFISPFQLALESGNVDTVIQCQHAKLLGGELALAVRLGNERVINYLLSREKIIASTNSYGAKVLEAAAEVGNGDIISLYFSSGGIYRSSALLKAVEAAINSHDDSIVLLLAQKRSVRAIDAHEAAALVKAVCEKRLALINILLGERFLPASIVALYDYKTPLCAVFYSGDTELVKRILDAGYRARPVDLPDEDAGEDEHVVSLFYTHFPPSKADPAWTRHLLYHTLIFSMTQELHECIRCTDTFEYYKNRRTPLQIAVEMGNTGSIELLIKAGADINAPAAKSLGSTAIQLAASGGFMNIARFLLEHGGDVNGQPALSYGRTALEGASEHGRLDMVQFLLENGVRLDGDMRIHYIRAIAYARKEGHYAVAKLLKEFGGWTDRDQEVYDREDIVHDHGYFVFDIGTQDWDFRSSPSSIDMSLSDDSDSTIS